MKIAALFVSVVLATPALGCAGKSKQKSEEQWVEDCVFERTLPRDQCQDMWDEAHPSK